MEKLDVNEVELNGVKYVRKDSISQNQVAESLDGMPYVIIRTESAGVHAGFLKKRVGQEVELLHARRLWYWKGAASLSQLAEEGTKNPDECKFPCEVSRIELMQAIEVILCTQKAKESIQNVKIWQM